MALSHNFSVKLRTHWIYILCEFLRESLNSNWVPMYIDPFLSSGLLQINILRIKSIRFWNKLFWMFALFYKYRIYKCRNFPSNVTILLIWIHFSFQWKIRWGVVTKLSPAAGKSHIFPYAGTGTHNKNRKSIWLNIQQFLIIYRINRASVDFPV